MESLDEIGGPEVLAVRWPRSNHVMSAALKLLLLTVAVGPSCRLNAQAVRTAAQLCSGTSAVKPPVVASQAQTGAPGTILRGTYIVVICSIDNTGKYSAPSNPIVAVLVSGGYQAGDIEIGSDGAWAPNTAGYELFVGVPLGSNPYSAPSAAQLGILTSYDGPQILGSNLKALPTSITVSSIPTEALPPGLLGSPYSQTTGATGGSIAAGGLPPGLSLNSSGLVSGTPTSGGTFLFSVTVSATTITGTGVPSQLIVTQQFLITITQPLNISPSSVSFEVQSHQIIGTTYTVVTVSGNAQNQPITLTQTQPWIIASIQTPSPGAAVVCCPATMAASVDPSQFNSPGSYSGSLGINVPGFTTGTLNYSVQVLTPPPPPPVSYDPTINLTSVVNGASFGKDFAVGSLVTLFGSNLASGTFSAQGLPLPVSLGDVQVATCPSTDTQLMGCTDVQLVYASPTQINLLACANYSPSGCTFLGGSQVLSVFRAGHLPAHPIQFPLLAAAPGTFLEGYDCAFNPLWNDPSPCGLSWTHYSSKQPLRGAVTDQKGHVLTSTNPALFTQQYTIWLTGLGVFTNSNPPQPVGVKIYGTPTNAFYDVSSSYVGPSPQFPGLYQINFPWPPGMMGSIATSDIQVCGDYKMEISFNIYEGAEQDPNVFQVPLLVKNGDVPCLPPK